jgi:hypothetical protein
MHSLKMYLVYQGKDQEEYWRALINKLIPLKEINLIVELLEYRKNACHANDGVLSNACMHFLNSIVKEEYCIYQKHWKGFIFMASEQAIQMVRSQ